MNNDAVGMPDTDFYKRVTNMVLCSDGGKINNLGISIIISEYEAYKAALKTPKGE